MEFTLCKSLWGEISIFFLFSKSLGLYFVVSFKNFKIWNFNFICLLSGQVSENKRWGSRKPPSSAPAWVARFRQIYTLKRNFFYHWTVFVINSDNDRQADKAVSTCVLRVCFYWKRKDNDFALPPQFLTKLYSDWLKKLLKKEGNEEIEIARNEWTEKPWEPMESKE